MCGICGYKIFGNSKLDESIIKKMNNTLSKRGPDNKGIYKNKNTILGHTRLSIIDLKRGNQPIHNEKKDIWIIYNGESYNFKKLRDKLINKGHKFYTSSDTEVLVHLYEEEGKRFIKKIDGMFALCIYDKKKDILFLAKDRFGKKPLFYSKINNSFVFGSEIKTLLEYPGIKKQIDRNSLQMYFFYGFIPSPRTIFQNIKKLEAGHYIIFQNNKIKNKKYWNIDFSKQNNCSLKQTIQKTDSLIKQAVKKRLVSDVPLGVFLSGGIDSSLVVSYMKEILGTKNVKAFSIGFKEKKFDESKYAKKVAKSLGIKHFVKIFSEKDCLKAIKEVYSYLDEPMSDPSIIPTYLLSKFTKKKVTVSLSGDGGDEIFLGYPKYIVNKLLDNSFLKIAVLNKAAINLMNSTIFPKKLRIFSKGLKYSPHIRNQAWISFFSPEELDILFNNKNRDDIFDPINIYHNNFKGKNFTDESSYLDIKLTLQDLYLLKVDRASMANSLEVRSPFLDKDLAEFAASIPIHHKLHKNKLKAILKKIAEKRIPKAVIKRKKMGFGIPVSKWIKGKLKSDIINHLSKSKIKEQGLFNPSYVEKIISEHLQNKVDNSMKIWSLYTFQLWYEGWIKNEKK